MNNIAKQRKISNNVIENVTKLIHKDSFNHARHSYLEFRMEIRVLYIIKI